MESTRAGSRLPLYCAVLLGGLMALSYSMWGSVSPPSPQSYGNNAWQRLWTGDIEGATKTFERALEVDPAFPYRWSDLGDALVDAGRTDEARDCFRRAVDLAPNSPQIALRAANFLFRVGSVDQALSLESNILRQTPDFDQMIFRSWIRTAGDVGGMLDFGIGKNDRAARSFFDFLASNGSRQDILRSWQWLESRGYAASQQAREWADLLLRDNAPAEAAAVWARYIAADGREYRISNWIDNGGFEKDRTGGAFDWNFVPVPGVRMTEDHSVAHSGASSLRLDLNSEENLDFHHVFQRTWTRPGKFRLEG